jgi:hypothetical protein
MQEGGKLISDNGFSNQQLDHIKEGPYQDYKHTFTLFWNLK